MLTQLHVQNYALIDDMCLDFAKGFNVLTGETGAGKSIIVDTVMLLLGDRAKQDDIRLGEDFAYVEGTFDIKDNDRINEILARLGIENEDDTLVLTREVNRTGRNRCRVNHRVVNLNDFREVGKQCINIYGQHDYQSIANPESQIELLDSLGTADYQFLRRKVKEAFTKMQKSASVLRKQIQNRKNTEDRLVFLQEQLESLNAYELQRGEEQRNQLVFNRMNHIRDLKDMSTLAVKTLYTDNDSAYTRIFTVLDQLRNQLQRDGHLRAYMAPLETAMISIDEVAKEISSYKDSLDIDPEEIAFIDERLQIYERIRRQYQCSVDEMIDKMEDWEEEIEKLTHAQFALPQLKKEYVQDKEEYEALAYQLREKRRELANEFIQRILSELTDLSMEKARFDVAFLDSKPTSEGIDDVLFLIAPNPGGELRPLHEIASGGEMSRIMLAFKTILTEKADIETVIFDEIDTGIGGVILGKVADKLAQVACHQQVLCVTHAPVIAAMADRHFFIEKQIENGKTSTIVEHLEDQRIVEELARMLGGAESWQMEHAEALLQHKKDFLDEHPECRD